jgi:hypothetical protein
LLISRREFLSGASAASAALLASSSFLKAPDAAAQPAWPADATNTGYTGTLTPWTGSTKFDSSGQWSNATIENALFETSTSVYISGSVSNLTFHNCKFVYTGALTTGQTGVVFVQGGNTSFRNCEVDGRKNMEYGINNNINGGLTVANCNIHDVGQAVNCPGNATINNNYFWNIDYTAGTDWHADGVFSQGTTTGASSNITVTGNTILMPGNTGLSGCIFIRGTSSSYPSTNILIENNLFAGGSYCMYTYPSDVPGTYTGANYQVLNNKFSTRYNGTKIGVNGLWYPPSTKYTNVTRSGNVIYETGEPCDTWLGV